MLLGNEIHVLDVAAKLDQCAEFLCKAEWGDVDFPPPFGREALPEVAYPPLLLAYCAGAISDSARTAVNTVTSTFSPWASTIW